MFDAAMREAARHYIPASEADLDAMLQRAGAQSLNDLFAHIPEDVCFPEAPALSDELPMDELRARLRAISERNVVRESYLGDGLPEFEVPGIVADVADIRGLTTAYTPYQPERAQGTLLAHWVYQCQLSRLTGFEAINSSLYDRSTAFYEAICAAIRLQRKSDTVLVSAGIYPGDLEVIRTLSADNAVQIETVAIDARTGCLDPREVAEALDAMGGRLAGLAFPQVNSLGNLEDVDALTELARERGIRSIAVIDPLLIGPGGLKPPVEFGTEGADIIVGEGQHLAIGPNFGGPGLGLFGVRHNEKVSNHVRVTPGRYVGKAHDADGRECRVMVLSTREQHIRRDKATSNICSNQAFLATLAGAALLTRGDEDLERAVSSARNRALEAVGRLLGIRGVRLAFPETPFFNEVTLELESPPADWIDRAREAGLHLGVDVSGRVPGARRHLLKLAFSDRRQDLDRLERFFREFLGEESKAANSARIPVPEDRLLRQRAPGLKRFGQQEVLDWYRQLGELNFTPDTAPYPLGSCTMKYNPMVNDWAANLAGFTGLHPQAPVEDCQGSLELLWEIQEWFKKITGLAGVTTQPVAGAQGELAGIKMIQAYHRAQGEPHRDVILIPHTAHGTNFATAAMAGLETKSTDGRKVGIVLLEAGDDGLIDFEDLRQKVEENRGRISGIMITNPNTTGLFEKRFREVADLVHADGGLVYMDGANMNAIAGWVDLGALGVDAVHQNLHKTWTIPHGGGGPGDAVVAVSEKLLPFLPGHQIERTSDGTFRPVRMERSIGSFHRHWGNFAHKVRAYTYLLRLGREGVPRMAAVAVLAARYLYQRLRQSYPSLPPRAGEEPRMHEFILTISDRDFARLEEAGVPRAQAIMRLGKLFLDFGYHAPTVAWPEPYGIMIEPTESFTLAELDRFAEAVEAIARLVRENPEVLRDAPHFTPVKRIDEVAANRNLVLSEPIERLPELPAIPVPVDELRAMPIEAIRLKLVQQVAEAEPAGV